MRIRAGRIAVLAGLFVLAVAPTAVFAMGGRAQNMPTNYQVSLAPDSTALPYADGQAFTITVRGEPGLTVNHFGYCSPQIPANPTEADMIEWCTSTVGQGQVGGDAPADTNGVVTIFARAGTGTATRNVASTGTNHTWLCDESNPCRLALSFTPPSGYTVYDASVEVRYRIADLNAACPSSNDDAVASALPDRLTDAWATWSANSCKNGQRLTTSSFGSDGNSLTQFETNSVDLAYGGASFAPKERKAVPTPLALNSAVIGVAGFYPVQSTVPNTEVWRRIDDLRMTWGEVAALLKGTLRIDDALQQSLIDRNPQLAVQATRVGFANANALAGPQASTAAFSALLHTKVPDLWKYPNNAGKFGDDAGKPLGSFTDFNQVTNSLAMLNLFTGKPQITGDIYKKLAEKPQGVSLVNFYLTDLATARQLGLAPVSLQNNAGQWVTPDDTTVTAAIAELPKNEQGLIAPAPGGTKASYPLAYVEYGFSPAERLVDVTCAPRAAVQSSLVEWLTFVTGPGQGLLGPTGLTPLPPSMAKDAAGTVTAIGASKPTGQDCPKDPTDPNTSPTTTPDDISSTPGAIGSNGGLGSFGGLPSSSFGSDFGAFGGVGGLGGPGALGSDGLGSGEAGSGDAASGAKNTRSGSPTDAGKALATVKMPKLGDAAGSPYGASILGLPFLVGMVSLAGWASGTKDLPALVAVIPGVGKFLGRL